MLAKQTAIENKYDLFLLNSNSKPNKKREKFTAWKVKIKNGLPTVINPQNEYNKPPIMQV